MPKEKKLTPISVRLTDDVLARLPPPSLDGLRAQFIRDAVEEKLAREEAKSK